MPRAKKFVLPYDGDPYKSNTRQKRKHKGKPSEEAMERKRKKAIAHREAKEAALQQPHNDGELLDPNVVNVPPDVDEPQAQVIVDENGLREVIDGSQSRERRRPKRSEEAMEEEGRSR